MPKRMLQGTVVSDKQDKTIIVRVERRFTHPVLKKTVRRSKKYHAHDEGNDFKAGEQVRIQECAPVSKLKSWTVLDRVGAAPVAVEEIAETNLNPQPDVEPKAEKPAKETKAKGKAKKAEPEAAEA